jgi:hypothetical protein
LFSIWSPDDVDLSELGLSPEETETWKWLVQRSHRNFDETQARLKGVTSLSLVDTEELVERYHSRLALEQAAVNEGELR